MDDQIAWLGQVVAIVAALGGLWYRIETRMSAGAIRANEKADLVAGQLVIYREMSNEALNKFKLEVAETYARNNYLKDVEARLISRFDGIAGDLHGMREDLQDAMIKMAEARTTDAPARRSRGKRL